MSPQLTGKRPQNLVFPTKSYTKFILNIQKLFSSLWPRSPSSQNKIQRCFHQSGWQTDPHPRSSRANANLLTGSPAAGSRYRCSWVTWCLQGHVVRSGRRQETHQRSDDSQVLINSEVFCLVSVGFCSFRWFPATLWSFPVILSIVWLFPSYFSLFSGYFMFWSFMCSSWICLDRFLSL